MRVSNGVRESEKTMRSITKFDFSSDDMQSLYLEHSKFVESLREQHEENLKEQKSVLLSNFERKLVSLKIVLFPHLRLHR